MHRHALHIISMLKGLLLLAASFWFAASHASDHLLVNLENYLHGMPYAVYAAYWFFVMFAGLLLVFPFSLAQDHMTRSAQGQHEELPVAYWLQGLVIELVFGTAMGCLISGSMRLSPEYWWLGISAFWTAYHMLAPRIHGLLVSDEEETKQSLGDLRDMMTPPLKEMGVELKDVRMLDEDDPQGLGEDVIFSSEDGKSVVYVPPNWARTWKPEEVTAVTLHKAWMMRSKAMRRECFLNALNALACFGGYALVYPVVSRMLELGPIHELKGVPCLLIWILVSMAGFRIFAFACYRKWMYEADSAVAAEMKSPDALIGAFERALQDAPHLADYPRWAEILLFHSPSMHRRIARLKK